MALEIKIDSKEIIKAMLALDQFHKLATEEVKQATSDNITWAHGFVAKYPPPPLHSNYVRTGTLGRRWASDINEFRGGIRATLRNPTEYMPYVQDETMQAKIHRGRWPTMQMLVRVPLALFRARYEQALKNLGDTLVRLMKK